jgi:hypothetical protein
MRWLPGFPGRIEIGAHDVGDISRDENAIGKGVVERAVRLQDPQPQRARGAGLGIKLEMVGCAGHGIELAVVGW